MLLPVPNPPRAHLIWLRVTRFADGTAEKFCEDSYLPLFVGRKLWMTQPLPKTPLSVVLVFWVLFPATMTAQSPGPREFLNTPVNQATAWVDYVGSSAETASADLPLPNNETVSRVLAPTLLASFPFRNRYAGLSLTVPYSKVNVETPAGKIETWGFNDPAIALHLNIFGLPALTRDQMATAIPQKFLTFHFTVTPPLGEYDRNTAVNTGANRWSFSPLFNLNIPLDRGVQWLEFYAWGRWYTNNTEFQGSNQLSQDPLGTVAAYYSHNLPWKMFAAIGGYYDYGGESYVNTIAQHDTANGFRPTVGIAKKFGRIGLTFRYENTASRPNAAAWNGLLVLKVSLGSVFKF